SGHQVVNNWNADFDTQGQSVTAENMSYNGNLGPGQSTQFGFQASRNGGSALPSTFTCSASCAGESSGPAGPPLGGPAGPSVGTGSAGWLRGEPGERAGDHLRVDGVPERRQGPAQIGAVAAGGVQPGVQHRHHPAVVGGADQPAG